MWGYSAVDWLPLEPRQLRRFLEARPPRRALRCGLGYVVPVLRTGKAGRHVFDAFLDVMHFHAIFSDLEASSLYEQTLKTDRTPIRSSVAQAVDTGR